MNSMDSVRSSTLYRLLQYNKKTRQFKKKIEGHIYFGFYHVDPALSGFSGVPGSWRQKWPTKIEKKVKNFIFGRAASSLLRAEGFSCSMDGLWGALGISKLKKKKNILPVFFLNLWSSKPPESGSTFKCWIKIHNTGFYDLVILCCRRNGGNTHFSLPFWSWAKFWFDLNTRIQRRNL